MTTLISFLVVYEHDDPIFETDWLNSEDRKYADYTFPFLVFHRMCAEFDKRYSSYIISKDHHCVTDNIAKKGPFKKLTKLLLCEELD